MAWKLSPCGFDFRRTQHMEELWNTLSFLQNPTKVKEETKKIISTIAIECNVRYHKEIEFIYFCTDEGNPRLQRLRQMIWAAHFPNLSNARDTWAASKLIGWSNSCWKAGL